MSTITRSAPSSAASTRRFVLDTRRAEREPGQHGVAGPAVVLDRARDPPHLEAELTERPRPLARLDRNPVVAAEAERDNDSLGRHEVRR